MPTDKIRNFAIIAHIDHGKSTLADRLLELTGTIQPGKLQAQHLDQLSLEREKGITIKMQPVRMNYQGYQLNLIDTPGHIDFGYEVSRALAAVEGAILLIDGTQGIQAQTLANLEIARRLGLYLIPVINKIDLQIPDLDSLLDDIQRIFNLASTESIYLVSGKTGQGVPELLEAIIKMVPPPAKSQQINATQALIFDLHFDTYKGIIAHVRLFSGRLQTFETLTLKYDGRTFKVVEVGTFAPDLRKAEAIEVGEIGYVATGIRDPGVVKIGDTLVAEGQTPALPGYREPQAVIFASVFSQEEINFETFKENIEKLILNDPSVRIEPTYSTTFGRGYLIGCMGLLHLEIFQERLKREFKTPIIISLPSLQYEVVDKQGQVIQLQNLEELPPKDQIIELREPWARVEIFSPFIYSEAIFNLVKANRGSILSSAPEGSFTVIRCDLPLDELITGFFDDLKSISSGYASLTWELAGYKIGDLVRLDILIAEEVNPALSRIVPRNRVEFLGRKVLKELKELLPRGLFIIKLQAAVEGRIMARETIPALKKDVTGYLYGGDRTRKMKLWQKQKKGKKKLVERGVGRVSVPNDVLIKILRVK